MTLSFIYIFSSFLRIILILCTLRFKKACILRVFSMYFVCI